MAKISVSLLKLRFIHEICVLFFVFTGKCLPQITTYTRKCLCATLEMFTDLGRHRKMSVLALLHVVIDLIFEKRVLRFTKSTSYSEIGNYPTFLETPPTDQNRCCISWLYTRVLYSSVSVSKLVHRYIIHRSSSRTEGTRCIPVPSPNAICYYFIQFY